MDTLYIFFYLNDRAITVFTCQVLQLYFFQKELKQNKVTTKNKNSAKNKIIRNNNE